MRPASMAEAIAAETVRHLPAPVVQPVPLGRLAACVQALDPGARALLDLSLRRGLRDDAIATIVQTDPFRLAWGRARAIERVAQEMGATGPGALRAVRAALPSLPEEAWGVPALPPPPPPGQEGVSTALAERADEAPVIYDARPVRPPLQVSRDAVRGTALAVAGAAVGLLLGRRRRRFR
jgi:hypothetical protein